jgi:hypothetical protein
MKRIIEAAASIYILVSLAACSIPETKTVEAPLEIREQAWQEAERYIGMEYEWGGEDFPERGIDCSGRIYFIDATYIEALGINGVTYRDYPADSLKIKSYGRMLLECLD